MRLLFRLVILGLAAFGAKTLYDKYGSRAGDLQGPANQFIDRAKSAVSQTAQQVSGVAKDTAQQVSGVAKDTAQQVSGAVGDLTDEVKSAAGDAADEATQVMSDEPASNNKASTSTSK